MGEATKMYFWAIIYLQYICTGGAFLFACAWRVGEKKNGGQALAIFQRDLEIPLSEICIILEEGKYGTYYEPIKGVKDSSKFLVDEYYWSFNLVHDFPSSTLFTTTTTHEKITRWRDSFFWCIVRRRRLPHSSMGILWENQPLINSRKCIHFLYFIPPFMVVIAWLVAESWAIGIVLMGNQ